MSQGERKFGDGNYHIKKTLNDAAPQNDILNSISYEKFYILTVQSGKFLFLSIQFCEYEKGTIYNLTLNFPL